MANTIETMTDNEICDGIITKTITELVDEFTTTIMGYRFYKNTLIAKLDMRNVAELRSMSLQDATALSEVNFPALRIANSYSMSGLDSLPELSLPAIEMLSSYSVRHCDSLKKVDFGENLGANKTLTLGMKALESNISLTTVILRPTTLCNAPYSLVDSILNNTPIASGTGYIYVPDELVEDYKVATNWSELADQIKPISELEE